MRPLERRFRKVLLVDRQDGICLRSNGRQGNVTITLVNASDVKVTLSYRSNGCVRKDSLHRRQRVRAESRWVDRRVVFDDVPFNLIEDDVAPNRNEAVESGHRQEKIA